MKRVIRNMLIAVYGMICICLTPGIDAQQQTPPRPGLPDGGPLRASEQFLLTTGFLSPQPSSANVLNEGDWQVDLFQTGTNNWAGSKAFADYADERPPRTPATLDDLRKVELQSALFFVDGEAYRTTVSIRTGLGSGYELEVSVPYLNFQGGFGDDWIEDFHDAFGFADGNRPLVPQDDYTVYYRSEEVEVFRGEDPSGGIGDVVVSLKKRFPFSSDRWVGAVQGLAKLATGDEHDLYSSGSEDYGVQILFARNSDDSCFHLNLGATYLGESRIFNLESQMRYSGMISYEHKVGAKGSAVLQAQAFQSPFRKADVQQLAETTYLLDLGYRYAMSSDVTLFFSFSENVVHFANSADFGLNLGLTITN